MTSTPPPPAAQPKNKGCFSCRFRGKKCSFTVVSTGGSICKACASHNVCCVGSGLDRPLLMSRGQPELEAYMAALHDWIRDHRNRIQGVPPFPGPENFAVPIIPLVHNAPNAPQAAPPLATYQQFQTTNSAFVDHAPPATSPTRPTNLHATASSLATGSFGPTSASPEFTAAQSNQRYDFSPVLNEFFQSQAQDDMFLSGSSVFSHTRPHSNAPMISGSSHFDHTLTFSASHTSGPSGSALPPSIRIYSPPPGPPPPSSLLDAQGRPIYPELQPTYHNAPFGHIPTTSYHGDGSQYSQDSWQNSSGWRSRNNSPSPLNPPGHRSPATKSRRKVLISFCFGKERKKGGSDGGLSPAVSRDGGKSDDGSTEGLVPIVKVSKPEPDVEDVTTALEGMEIARPEYNQGSK